MKTAEDLLYNNVNINAAYRELVYVEDFDEDIKNLMIEFARMHVKAVLEAEKQRVRMNSKGFVDTEKEEKEIDNIYPITNIK